ncbi:hypothetical protein GOP47_0001235 [Adiantum capillus-veneris]|uniref:Uncharacterized protein n=1 Tax=Adiantum capillus-veneris TaxID=13818 RepID=A0A9D4VEG6_ADICA|nr:hypothetical protein GOP47_0001235 [Adiantum capillus-veneris]
MLWRVKCHLKSDLCTRGERERERERENESVPACVCSMASFTSSVGSKRVRPWDSCQDVEKLKEMLEERETQIESLKKQRVINEGDIVKELQQSLQEKEGRIQELLCQADNSNAASAFGKLFDANASKSAPETVLRMDDVRKGRQCTSMEKSKLVASDSEEEVDGSKGLASDSTDDEGFTPGNTDAAADDDDDDDDDNEDDDDEYIAARSTAVASRGSKAKKAHPNGHVPDTKKSFTGNVLNLRASIQKQILSQMVYRPGLKYGKSKVAAEVPNLSEEQIKAILGDELFAKASCRGKLIQLKASDDDIDTLFKCSFTKGLRYGAILALCDGLKFAFTKATGVLKVTGVYTMQK